MIKVNNRNTRTKCEICSKLAIKTSERRQRRSGVFIINFEPCSSVSFVNYEQIKADWVFIKQYLFKQNQAEIDKKSTS